MHIHVQSFIAWLQSRYVGYYERVKKDLGGHLPPETKKRITSVKIEGLKGQYKYFGLKIIAYMQYAVSFFFYLN